jgi:hypothetical protein
VKEIIIPTGIDKSPKLPNLAVDIKIMPTLTERIKLAKKIFTQSFVVSKRSKEQSWLRQSADEADLEMVKHAYIYIYIYIYAYPYKIFLLIIFSVHPYIFTFDLQAFFIYSVFITILHTITTVCFI